MVVATCYYLCLSNHSKVKASRQVSCPRTYCSSELACSFSTLSFWC